MFEPIATAFLAVNWLHVVLAALWLLPVPKLTDINLTALETNCADMISPRMMKIVSVIAAFSWPILLLRIILVAIFYSIFERRK